MSGIPCLGCSVPGSGEVRYWLSSHWLTGIRSSWRAGAARMRELQPGSDG